MGCKRAPIAIWRKCNTWRSQKWWGFYKITWEGDGSVRLARKERKKTRERQKSNLLLLVVSCWLLNRIRWTLWPCFCIGIICHLECWTNCAASSFMISFHMDSSFLPLLSRFEWNEFQMLLPFSLCSVSACLLSMLVRIYCFLEKNRSIQAPTTADGA